MTDTPAQHLEAWRERLGASRARLLESLRDVTERDFAQPLEGGETVVQALASLAPAERAVIEAGSRTPAADPDATPQPPPAKPLPPQVMHDLAGARYETLRLLEAALDAGSGGPAADLERLDAAVEQVARAEETMAARIEVRERPGSAAAGQGGGTPTST